MATATAEKLSCEFCSADGGGCNVCRIYGDPATRGTPAAAPARRRGKQGTDAACSLCPCVKGGKVECEACGRTVCRYDSRRYFGVEHGVEFLATECRECFEKHAAAAK